MAPDTPGRGASQDQDQDEPFATLLTLEDQFYTEGHTLGVADGSRTGRIEGRLFGLEQGFTKFASIGRLSGRAAVWQARTSPVSTEPHNASTRAIVPPLSGSARLQKHVERLAELTDGESLETRNTEDAVSECDERLAGANAKFALISRIVGESEYGDVEVGSASNGAEINVLEDAAPRGKPKAGLEMEDFAGLPQHIAKARKEDPNTESLG
ncbi:hypothetical protein LTR53_011479 [Teratosphaeriaceae sp. CCFEE 6253]|nr:hypothetical protein LTR53_011479 [Teratosphaeriaceae sp. CCFEE 6253]